MTTAAARAMVTLSLACACCRHEFEAQFRSLRAFKEQNSASELACPNCGDIRRKRRKILPLPADAEPRPPRTAEWLLYVILPASYREYLPGDLEEEFKEIIVPKFGRKSAKFWYYGQVIRSISPIFRRGMGKIISAVTFGSLANWVIRRLGI
jgi:hypothetical protein